MTGGLSSEVNFGLTLRMAWGCPVVAPETPLVGRDLDVSQLGRVLEQAGEGAGSMVLVSGEAGIGKTRLCAELNRWHQRRGGRVLLGRAQRIR